MDMDSALHAVEPAPGSYRSAIHSRLLDLQGVRDHIPGASRTWLFRLAKDGDIQAVHLRGRRFFTEDSVLAFIAGAAEAKAS